MCQKLNVKGVRSQVSRFLVSSSPKALQLHQTGATPQGDRQQDTRTPGVHNTL